MQRTDLVTGFGSGILYLKYTITGAEMAAANSTPGLTQAMQLLENPGGNPFLTAGTTAVTLNTQNLIVPQGGFLNYVRFKHSVKFTNDPTGTITSVTVTLRKTGGVGLTGTPVSGNLFGAVADGTLAEFTQIVSGQHSAFGLEVLITTIGANVSTITTGSVDIYLQIVNPTTASSTTVS